MLTQAEIDRIRAADAAWVERSAVSRPEREKRHANSRRAAEVARKLIRVTAETDPGKANKYRHWAESWLAEDEAAEWISRSPRTLRQWATDGWVRRTRQRKYSRLDLYVARSIVAANYRNRKSVAGPGRPQKDVEREQVAALLAEDSSVSDREVARRLGVSHAFVGVVRREWMEKVSPS